MAPNQTRLHAPTYFISWYLIWNCDRVFLVGDFRSLTGRGDGSSGDVSSAAAMTGDFELRFHFSAGIADSGAISTEVTVGSEAPDVVQSLPNPSYHQMKLHSPIQQIPADLFESRLWQHFWWSYCRWSKLHLSIQQIVVDLTSLFESRLWQLGMCGQFGVGFFDTYGAPSIDTHVHVLNLSCIYSFLSREMVVGRQSEIERKRRVVVVSPFRKVKMWLFIKYLTLVVVVVVMVMGVVVGIAEVPELTYDYYQDSCPDVENIVKKAILPILLDDPTAPAAFLRLLFHDCQVQGCDASILLDSDNQNMNSEIGSIRNFGIRRRESIGHIKSILEAVCPGQVSCADVIALAAKESVSFSGGPSIQIPLGRRDSTSSKQQMADSHLPPQSINVDGFLNIFMAKGMNLQESVAIIGAHTLGVGHCINIVDRIYNQKQPSEEERINLGFQILLRLKCPTRVPFTNLTFVRNDITSLIFDNQYYRDVMNGRGLFHIDSSISMDHRTAPIVEEFAADQEYFFQVFSSAFVKLSSSNVLTGEKGQIRRQCNQVN
ncbi:peroxidase 29-like [Telopea speciosissima]|uniref:peroxidase 29-like n=1 Tax=Telopea speciosissima TaxID=54955 RepID=UPI001CC745B0|nr:peroxidase 29-like [Telopea speciosissima]